MNHLFFTCCSNNYLAQAKALTDSIYSHHKDVTSFIFLVDKKSDLINYDEIKHATIIPIERININQFDEIKEHFNIIELSTAVKASCFKYLLNQYGENNYITYLDPDTYVFRPLTALFERYFEQYAILLTPHITTPIPIDDKSPFENVFLNYGIYNLGFLSLNMKSKESVKLLDWWEERTLTFGVDNPKDGFFVDQLWMNLTPLFFKNVKILPELGLNCAPWNLHERLPLIENDNGIYIKNESEPLYFYHFSSFSFKNPDCLAKNYSRFTFENAPSLKEIYDNYLQQLIENKITEYSTIAPAFSANKINTPTNEEKNELTNKKRFITKTKSVIKLFLPPVFIKLIK